MNKMKNTLFILALTLIMTVTLNAQQKLTINKEKTKLSWLGEKVTGEHTGTIKSAVGMA